MESSGPIDILNIVHRSARKGTLLASCEPEVRELMHQIDVLLSSQTLTHQQQLDTLKQQVQSRDKELSSLRLAIREKSIQSDKFREDLTQSQRQLKVRTSDHETQLLRLRTELNRLNKCYEKLKNRKPRTGNARVCDSHVISSESDNKELKDTLEVLQERCESYQKALDCQKRSQEKLQKENDELTCKLISNQRELVRLEDELQHCESKDDMEVQLIAKDKKITLLKKERDMARGQTKDSLSESEKWYNQAMRLNVLNKELETRVNDIAKQLNELHYSMEHDEKHLAQEVTQLKRIVSEKDSNIRSLTEEQIGKLHSEELHHQQELQTLQMTLQTLTLDNKKLREDNSKFRRRLEGKSYQPPPVQNELKSELDKRETELYENRVQLLKKDTLLQTYHERISHLEELLSEATLQINSSHDDVSSGTASHSQSHDRSHDLPQDSPGIKIDLTAQPDGMSNSNTTSLVAGFQEKLAAIMNNHFTQIDQSLQQALADK